MSNANGSALDMSDEHPFITRADVDDLKGSVQALTRNVSQLVTATRDQVNATKLLEIAIARLADTLTTATQP